MNYVLIEHVRLVSDYNHNLKVDAEVLFPWVYVSLGKCFGTVLQFVIRKSGLF